MSPDFPTPNQEIAGKDGTTRATRLIARLWEGKNVSRQNLSFLQDLLLAKAGDERIKLFENFQAAPAEEPADQALIDVIEAIRANEVIDEDTLEELREMLDSLRTVGEEVAVYDETVPSPELAEASDDKITDKEAIVERLNYLGTELLNAGVFMTTSDRDISLALIRHGNYDAALADLRRRSKKLKLDPADRRYSFISRFIRLIGRLRPPKE